MQYIWESVVDCFEEIPGLIKKLIFQKKKAYSLFLKKKKLFKKNFPFFFMLGIIGNPSTLQEYI